MSGFANIVTYITTQLLDKFMDEQRAPYTIFVEFESSVGLNFFHTFASSSPFAAAARRAKMSL